METKANNIITRAGVGPDSQNLPLWLHCGPKGPFPQVLEAPAQLPLFFNLPWLFSLSTNSRISPLQQEHSLTQRLSGALVNRPRDRHAGAHLAGRPNRGPVLILRVLLTALRLFRLCCPPCGSRRSFLEHRDHIPQLGGAWGCSCWRLLGRDWRGFGQGWFY